jgi:hypothetical protein
MTTCYCEDCHAQGRAPYVKDTYTRAWMTECRDRDARARAMQVKQEQDADGFLLMPPPVTRK